MSECPIEELIIGQHAESLMSEYAARAEIPELAPAKPDIELYKQLGRNGFLRPFKAEQDGVIVGFLVLTVTPMAHYSKVVPTVESLFVRRGASPLAARRLMSAARAWAKSQGFPILMASAAIGSDAFAFYNAQRGASARAAVFGITL